MAASVPDPRLPAHLLTADLRPTPAKASLRKPETTGNRQQIGRAVARAMQLSGLSLKEFAAAVQRDERQCSRWLTGDERVQLDTVFAVVSLRQSLVIALAELAADGSVSVETVIRVRSNA